MGIPSKSSLSSCLPLDDFFLSIPLRLFKKAYTRKFIRDRRSTRTLFSISSFLHLKASFSALWFVFNNSDVSVSIFLLATFSSLSHPAVLSFHQATCSCSDSPQKGTERTFLSDHHPYDQGEYAPFQVGTTSLQDACVLAYFL